MFHPPDEHRKILERSLFPLSLRNHFLISHFQSRLIAAVTWRLLLSARNWCDLDIFWLLGKQEKKTNTSVRWTVKAHETGHQRELLRSTLTFTNDVTNDWIGLIGFKNTADTIWFKTIFVSTSCRCDFRDAATLTALNSWTPRVLVTVRLKLKDDSGREERMTQKRRSLHVQNLP